MFLLKHIWAQGKIGLVVFFQLFLGQLKILVPFNENKVCGKGGLYFCRYKDSYNWIKVNGLMEYIWDVTIPKDEKIVDMGNKLKSHKLILSNNFKTINHFQIKGKARFNAKKKIELFKMLLL